MRDHHEIERLIDKLARLLKANNKTDLLLIERESKQVLEILAQELEKLSHKP